ncbi:hypothetical protein [Kitasatospora cathayae]|uniref:DUF11 domain-containing protein n=1 Tax=Kitasatospora cathayae TaxID=3004092 RepID=A0ABY7Q1I2_9ACTN|nr:hypothetical protein [Kitasatospora sp. HUAS 3-15]WBP86319.1 hypothetical protein O1G21_11015 [Kitasatospora sp. HUAS 3-15]
MAARHTGGVRAAAPVSRTFDYTGASESYTVPVGAVVTITADGAGGGDLTGCSVFFGNPGGTGGRVVTTLPVATVSTTYTINVGGAGGKDCGSTAAGGYNGGGAGGKDVGDRDSGAGGGGASSVSVNGGLLVVGGGGGGAGNGSGFTVPPLSGGRGGDGGRDATDGSVGVSVPLLSAPGEGGGGASTPRGTAGAGGAGGQYPAAQCRGVAGATGSSFAGAAVGNGGAGGQGAPNDFPDICVGGSGGGGGGGGYFGGGGGGGSAEPINHFGEFPLVGAAGGGGGGGGSSFATPSGSGTSFVASPIGTANNNGQVTISYRVLSIPVLTISKRHTGNFTQRQQGTYTIAVGNDGSGPTDGSTVTMKDTLPSGLTAAGISGPGWSCDLSTVTCNRRDVLVAGAAYPDISLTVDVSPTAPAQVTNTATASGGGDGTATATDPTTVIPAVPSLTISKAHSGNFIQGRQGTYTITVGNNGNGPTNGTPVIMKDTLPSAMTAAGISGDGWACDLSTVTCNRRDVLVAGAAYPDISLTVDVSPTAPAQVTNTATASGGGDGTATATDPTTINPAGPSLTISKTHSGKFTPNQGGVYTITVGNNGTAPTRGTPVIVKDTLPAGLTAAGISGSNWTCDLSAVTCTRSDPLAAGASYPPITLTVNVSPQAPRELVNTATVTGGGDGTATAVDRVIRGTAPPSLTISKTHTGNFTPGQQGTYTITVGNDGSGPTDGSTVTMRDTLPSGLTAAGISGDGWACDLSTVTCTRSDPLAAGASYPSITLTVKVSCRVPHEVTNTATATGGGDTITHTATDPTTIKRDREDEGERCHDEHRVVA